MHDTTERPTSACVLCPPPKTRAWRLADPGYRTCATCYDRLRSDLKDIDTRYSMLDASPGASGDGTRGAPGFGSRPAASPHIIVMTDWRSKSCEVAVDGIQYVWDPLADDTLEPGQYGPPGGAYTQKREVWYGRDGRGHSEQENPARSVPLTLSALAEMIAEERGQTPPRVEPRRQHRIEYPQCHLAWIGGRAHPEPPPPDLMHEIIRWLDNQMDWITRHDLVVEFRDDLRTLVKQLMPVTGDPHQRSIGLCPNVIDEGSVTRECRTRLYANPKGSDVSCTACGRRWEGDELLRLGDLLVAS